LSIPPADQHVAHADWLSIVPQVPPQGHWALLEHDRQQNPPTHENPSSHCNTPVPPPAIAQAAPSGERRWQIETFEGTAGLNACSSRQ